MADNDILSRAEEIKAALAYCATSASCHDCPTGGFYFPEACEQLQTDALALITALMDKVAALTAAADMKGEDKT